MDKVRGIRAYPVCPLCNGRKFRIIAKHDDGSIMLECLRCSYKIII